MGEKRAGAALLQAIRPAICSKIDKKLRGFMHSEENSAAAADCLEKQSRLIRVMHVDDDPDLRLLISASLRDFGCVVATAGSVAEALQLASELTFNLLSSMCDCQMAPALSCASNCKNCSPACR